MSTGRVMRACALSMVVAAGGCQTTFEHNPPLPGGAGGVGGSSAEGDGGPEPGGDGGPSARVSGQLCLLIDLRDPTVCDLVDMSRYRVTDTASGASAATDSDGGFELVVDDGGLVDLVVETDSADIEIVRSVIPVPVADGLLVPVFAAQDFENLKLDLTLASEPEVGTSTLVVHAFDNGFPAPLVDLRDPLGTSGVFYDDDLDPVGWAPNGVTGGFGAILTLGVDPSADGLLLGADDEQIQVAGIPYVPDTMTFAEIEIGGQAAQGQGGLVGRRSLVGQRIE